jgi:hypothetical protein
MRLNLRSVSGALLMLMILPAIVGLLACLPVPIGDPERSRVDPEITGVWAIVADSETVFYVFEPFDKRTWLLTGVPLEEGDNADFSDYDLSSYEGLVRLMETEAVGEDGATATEMVMYKTWMTKLGGVWFMTWEPKGLFGSEQFAPRTWYVFRVEKPDPETLELTLIGGKKFFPDDLEKTRRAYERVIKKNAKNPEMYTEEPWPLVKVADEHMEFFEDLAEEVIADSD